MTPLRSWACCSSAEASSHATEGNRIQINVRPGSGQAADHPLALRLAELQSYVRESGRSVAWTADQQGYRFSLIPDATDGSSPTPGWLIC